MPDEDFPQAYVKEVDGKLVLVDPVAAGVIQALQQFNGNIGTCRHTLEIQLDRVIHFTRRIRELGKTLPRSPSYCSTWMIRMEAQWQIF